MPETQPDSRYQNFWRQFRAGRFQAAQESLAPLRQECQGMDRDFYLGLSQVAECLQHLNEGGLERAHGLARQAAAGLGELGPSYGGVQLQSLLLGLSACIEDARLSAGAHENSAGPRLRIPRVDLAFGLDPESTTD